MKNKFNKIGLGTAQFIKGYGISEDKKKINKILKQLPSNINLIDTSPVYGDAYKNIRNLKKNLNIVTKVVIQSKHLNNFSKKKIFSIVNKNIKTLNKKSIYGLLIHNPIILKNKNFEKLILCFDEIKKKFNIKKIGVSIYNKQDIDFIFHKWTPDIIQLPLNVFDRRLLRNGFIKKVKKKGVEIHCRSCFLQGLLLQDSINLKFKKWTNLFQKWDKFCIKNNITKLEASIIFLKNLKLNYLIVGVDSINQLKEVSNIIKNKKTMKFPKNISSNNLKLIDPRLWSNL